MEKICVVANDYPSKGRPVYVFVEQLVNAIADMNQDICVVAPQSITKSFIRNIPLRPVRQEYITGKGNRYMIYRPYILTFGNQGEWLYKIVNRFNRRSVDKYIKSSCSGILYAHFWNNAIRIMDYAEKNNIPVFVACGEGDNAMEKMMVSLSAKDKECIRNVVKGVISVSTENKRKCIEYSLIDKEKVMVLPNAVNAELFHFTPRNYELRTTLGIKKDDFAVIFVGSFIPRKGCGVLAKAIDRLNDEKVKVLFVGAVMPGDEDDPRCHGIVFKGAVPHDELPKYYACADVFVLPTQNEGCSNAIVEALAMGLPVISSNRAFNDDILNNENSIRIDPLDVDEIAKAIIKMRDDKLLYNGLSEGALKTAIELRLDKRAERIITYINQQMNQSIL